MLMMENDTFIFGFHLFTLANIKMTLIETKVLYHILLSLNNTYQ